MARTFTAVDPGVKKQEHKRSLYRPFPCRITQVRPLTRTEKLFRFSRLDGSRFTHRPGQFFQVSVAGIGEAPISVSSSPSRGHYLEMGIRKIGKVTGALHAMKEEDVVGMRGPFGTYFPIRGMRHQDLVLIAGGCGLAPLRALIQWVEDQRKDFGEVAVLYGARSPSDCLYVEEFSVWKQSHLRLEVTVDRAEPSDRWEGSVGLITQLIAPLELDPHRTVAVVCGPPVMYPFVIAELRKKNISDGRIIVSLERYMKCGVGKCGHCTIEHLYCCLDGPVFSLEDIALVRNAL